MATTVNSIPKNLRWTPQRAERHLQRHEYIHVGGKGDVSKRRITSAPSIWAGSRKRQAEPRAIYLTNLRITGEPEAVLHALRLSGVYTDEQIKKSMDAAITRENIGPIVDGRATANTGQARLFNEDVERYWQYKVNEDKVKKGKASTISLDLAVKLAEGLKEAKNVTQPKGQGQTARAAGSTGRGKSVAEKLAAVRSSGKILDVSNIIVKGGTGNSRTPPVMKNAKIRWLPNFPLASNNMAAFLQAVDQLPGGQAAHQNEIAQMNQLLNSTGTLALNPLVSGTSYASPQLANLPMVAERVPSPRRGTGMTPTRVSGGSSPRGQLSNYPSGLPSMAGL